MTRNRPRSTSNALKPRPQQQQPIPSRSPAVSRNANHHVQPPIPSRTPNNASVHPPDVAMSPASRYKQNLKVLRRLDPTILSIFDQFSYVCLYHHDGTKWEKKGIEGSMFLFEREAEPLYGFFILNRMNKNDYVQCLSSTDEMEISGQYLMYRTQHPGGPGPHHWLSNQPATPEMIGLWSHSTGAREPMGDVMMRLYGFVKRGIRYPDQFRYGPGKKPPPSTTTPSQSDVTDDSEVETNTNAQNSHNPRVYNNQPHNGLNAVNAPTPANAGGGMSELDQLFAKLVSSSGGAPASVVTAVLPQVQPNQANTLMSMLASMNGANGHGHDQNQAFVAGPQAAIAPAPATAAEPPRGQALLSSIFASVSGGGGGLNGLLQQSQSAQTQPSYNGTQIQTQMHTNGYNPSTQSHPHPSSHPQVSAPTQSSATPELEILSPKPSTAGLPQILTTNVIHELLGMPSSRSASASSSSYDSTGGSVEGAGVGGVSQGPHHHGHNYHPNPHHARLGIGRRTGGYDADADVDVTTGDEGDVSAVLEDGDAAEDEDEDEDGEDERSESSSGQRYPVPERRGYVYSGAVSAGVGSRRTSNPMIRMASGTSLNGYHHHPHNHTSHHQGPNQIQHQSPHQNHTLLRVNSQTRVGGDVTPRASAGRQLVEVEVERQLVAKIGGGSLGGGSGSGGQESSSYGGSQSQSQEQPQPQPQQMYIKPYQTVSRFSAPSTFPSSAPASLPASSSTSTTISTSESALSSPPIPPSSAPAPSSTTLQASMSASTIIPSSSSTPSRVKGRFQSGSELWPLPLPLQVPASSPSPSPMRKGKGSGPNNRNNASLSREGAISENGQSSPSLSLGRTAGAQGDLMTMTMTSPITSSVYVNANSTMMDYDEGVVELDFSETAVLSDLHAFEARGKSVVGGGSSLRAKEKEKEKARKRGGLPDFGGQSQSQGQSVDLKDGVKMDKKAGSNLTTIAPQANVSTTTATTTATTKLPPSSVSAVTATTVIMGTNTNPGSPSTNLSLGSSSGTGFGASPSGLRGPIPIVFMAAAQAKAREKEKEKAGESVNGNSGLVYANGVSVPHVAGVPTSVSTTSTIATPKTPPRQQPPPPSTTTTTSPSGIQRGIAHTASLSEVAKNVVLNELSRNPIMDRRGPNSVMERNEFVREVLTLIHTDKSFVERLYQGYLEMV